MCFGHNSKKEKEKKKNQKKQTAKDATSPTNSQRWTFRATEGMDKPA